MQYRVTDTEYYNDENKLHRRHQMLRQNIRRQHQLEQQRTAIAECGCSGKADDIVHYEPHLESISCKLENIKCQQSEHWTDRVQNDTFPAQYRIHGTFHFGLFQERLYHCRPCNDEKTGHDE